MEVARLFKLNANADIAFISGVLRVTIEHGANVLRLVFDLAIFIWVASEVIEGWTRVAPLSKVLFALTAAGAVADFAYQLTGSEILEFGPEGLKIQRNYFGWEYIRSYAIDKCGELSWQPEDSREGEFALNCRVGWRKVQFGKYLNESQAIEILSQLQSCLPHVAQELGAFPGAGKEHITRLGLS